MRRLVRRPGEPGTPRRATGAFAARLAGSIVGVAGITLMGAGTFGSPAGAFAATTSGAVAPASAGSNNKEDVWLDNVGNAPGSGHSQDPHLNCADINVWGDGLSESSGNYIVDGWSPSGSGEQVYPTSGTGTWSYDTTSGGDQVIAVLNAHVLIGNAIADGDTPGAQGYHFKLQYSQNPDKHKTFWVTCASTTTSSTTSSSQSTSSSTQSTTSSTASSTSQTTSSSNSTTSSSSTSSASTTSTSSEPTTTSSATTSSQATSSQSSTALTTVVTDPSTSTSSVVSSSSSTSVPDPSTSTSTASTASTSASNPSTGVLGASTTTPSTGADVEFGFGIALLLGGAGVMIGATRINRNKRQ